MEGRQLDLRDETATAGRLTELEERFGGIHTVVYASGPFVQLDYLSLSRRSSSVTRSKPMRSRSSTSCNRPSSHCDGRAAASWPSPRRR